MPPDHRTTARELLGLLLNGGTPAATHRFHPELTLSELNHHRVALRKLTDELAESIRVGKRSAFFTVHMTCAACGETASYSDSVPFAETDEALFDRFAPRAVPSLGHWSREGDRVVCWPCGELPLDELARRIAAREE